MIPASAAYLAALAGPVQVHTGRIRLHEAAMVNSSTGGGFGYPGPTTTGSVLSFRDVADLPVTGDPELTVDGTASTMRSITFDMPVSALRNTGDASADAPFTPERLISGCEISVFKGIYVSSAGTPLDSYVDPYTDPYAGGSVSGRQLLEAQVARLKIVDAQLSVVPGQITVTAVDRMVTMDEFPISGTYTPGERPRSYLRSIWTLIAQAIPAITAIGTPIFTFSGVVDGAFIRYDLGPYALYWHSSLSTTAATKDGVQFTGSRVDALNALAKSVGGIIRNRPDGSFEVIPAPAPADNNYVWRFTAGENGLLIDATVDYSRSDSFNAVGGVWSSTDGTSSGRVFLVDNVSSSPTYWLGPFGKRPRPDEQLDLVETEAEAIVATQALLDTYKGRATGISITGVCNPLLLPGDQIQVAYPDKARAGLKYETQVYVIDSLSYSLSGGSMDIKTRQVRT